MYLPDRNIPFYTKTLKHCLLLNILSFTFSCTSAPEQKAEVTKEVFVEPTAPASTVGNFEQSLIDQGLVNIQDVDPNIKVELKYSTEDNFFGEDVYEDLTKAYLQLKPAQALAAANEELMNIDPNLRLLVYDGVRPLSVQKILWDKLDTIPPPLRSNYVANPEMGSIHNYGCAVDLTIFDVARDSVLDMGTKYDYFGELAYPRMEDQMVGEGKLTKDHIIHRKLLRSVMEKYNFMPITSEWWHFNYHSRETAKKIYTIIK
ncbi:peptidase M15 [Emticicia sp. CRIBPO]|uniref:M15 family metallopeptidase n=1 Tax=Emticicia sp. CRIBPO TaxID=2683258 RepID=UPI0014135F3D|nr:M15 family metallopeptidase [Emticicia sp. CRIBPO]NBA88870.1 peptidase M15 [Emticicia sp. CRIBPO]